MKKALLAAILLNKPSQEQKPKEPTRYPSLPSCQDHKFIIDVGPFGPDYGDYNGECMYCGASIHDWPSSNPFVIIH